MNAVECKNLVRKFVQGEATIYGLHDVDLTVEKGEFVCLSGPSGSGKSTLLAFLGGFLDPVFTARGTVAVEVPNDKAVTVYLREIFVSGLREFLAELKVSVPVTRLVCAPNGLNLSPAAPGFRAIASDAAAMPRPWAIVPQSPCRNLPAPQ